MARCPHIPTDVVASLLRIRRVRSAAQLLLRLRTAGLTKYEKVQPGPLVESKVVRLWTLTPAGRAIVSARGLAIPLSARGSLPYEQFARRRGEVRPRNMAMLVVAYRLLGSVVRELDRSVRVAAWEHPWIRTLTRAKTGRARHVRLPAAAALIQDNSDGRQPRGLLLLPDLGTTPVALYRPVLRGLIDLAHASDADVKDEALLVVGIGVAAAESSGRLEAWHALLEQVARRAGEEPPRAQVFVWPQRVTDSPGRSQRPGSQADQVFALIARHPLLTHQQLATLLGTSAFRINQLLAQLLARDWLRAIPPDEVPSDVLALISGRQRRPAHVELTPAGRLEAARRLLLPSAVATRYHGLLGNDGRTRQFLRHIDHTLGANAVFVALVAAARLVTEQGGDDALDDWRSGAACARGRFRPDGYGCYRRGVSRFGFFLEFDRGTEKPGEYAAKIAAYYRYRDCGAAAHEYAGFPTLLVVTTREAAEFRFAHQAQVASEKHAGKPLSILLTRTDVVEATREGVLGPIWRSPGLYGEQPRRGYWLSGEPSHTTGRHLSRGDR
ncbi:MAG: replication-relaxation family protein [Chloroflexota bacterium]|nr:replication-relaxation family protein [Chloroflexota bacterium]